MHRAPLQPSAPTQEPTTPAAAQAQAQGHPQANNPAIPTSVAIDASWVVVGLANSRIQVFSARTGVLAMSRGLAVILLVVYVCCRLYLHRPPPAESYVAERSDAPQEKPEYALRVAGAEGSAPKIEGASPACCHWP